MQRELSRDAELEPGTRSSGPAVARRNVDRAMIEDALARTGGNRVRAARLLGISRRTLYYRLEAFGVPES